MRKLMKWFGLLALLWLPLLAVAAGPNVVLKDVDGKDHRVDKYIGKGKWVIVVVWAHNCPICNREIDQMAFFHAAHRKKDAMVLGISIDGYSGRAKAKAFIDRHTLNFPNLLADIPVIVDYFGEGDFLGTPTYYIYTPAGKKVKEVIGPMSQEDAERFIGSYKLVKK